MPIGSYLPVGHKCQVTWFGALQVCNRSHLDFQVFKHLKSAQQPANSQNNPHTVWPCNNGWIFCGINAVKNCSSKFHDIVKQCLEQMHCFYVFGIVKQSFSQHANEKCQRASGTLHAWNRQAGFGKHDMCFCLHGAKPETISLHFFLAKWTMPATLLSIRQVKLWCCRRFSPSASRLFFLLLIRAFWSPDHRCMCVRRKIYSNSEFQRARFIHAVGRRHPEPQCDFFF